MEDGGWRMEDGGWRMEDGGWRMEDGGRRTVDGGQRTEDRGQRTEDRGQRTVEADRDSITTGRRCCWGAVGRTLITIGDTKELVLKKRWNMTGSRKISNGGLLAMERHATPTFSAGHDFTRGHCPRCSSHNGPRG